MGKALILSYYTRFCQLQKKPVNIYGVDAPLDDAVAELRQGKEREALFLLAHPYVSFVSHPYRLLSGSILLDLSAVFKDAIS